MTTPITETQVRAARELLRWDQKKLAEEADLSLMTIKRYELSQSVSEDVVAQIAAAFERAGIILFGETSINGVAISGAVALRAWARPEPRPPTRKYKEGKQKGRPKGSKNKKATADQRQSDKLTADNTDTPAADAQTPAANDPVNGAQ